MGDCVCNDMKRFNNAKWALKKRGVDIHYSFVWIDPRVISPEKFKEKCENTEAEIFRKKIYNTLINSNCKGFFAAKFEASLDNCGELKFERSASPAEGFSPNWWNTKALSYCPERGSRLATEEECIIYDAYRIIEGTATLEEVAKENRYENGKTGLIILEK